MHEKLHFTDLPIVSWNIHGIFTRHSGFRYNKLHSPLFKSAVGNSKIFGLIETHHVSTEIDQLQIQGFKCFNVCRKKKHDTRAGSCRARVRGFLCKGGLYTRYFVCSFD